MKGWPEPSLEYQRERWELYLKLAQVNVDTYRSLVSKLKNNPRQHLLEAWDHDKKYSRDEISAFNGPDDPAYSTYLKKEYDAGLKRSEIKLESVKKAKP